MAEGAVAAEIPILTIKDVRGSMSVEDSSCLDISYVSKDVSDEEKYELYVLESLKLILKCHKSFIKIVDESRVQHFVLVIVNYSIP